ncbi:MAG: ribonuclease T2 [Rhodobacteraceae bacterium]|nr:ribonuclease T2 [Paracoccaceae bacterium]
MRWVFMLLMMAGFAHAEGERAGHFDYYVLALSWSPNWCALEGDARNAEQCERDLGWNLHGLWPQYHAGWPSYCKTAKRAPSRRMTGQMQDIMGSGGLAWHQWKKHGTCSGLSAETYFELSRKAYGKINRPRVFRKIDKPLKLPARVVEEAFLKANDTIEADGLTVVCKARYIQEVRICLSKNLDFVPCGRDVLRDCTIEDAVFNPLR